MAAWEEKDRENDDEHDYDGTILVPRRFDVLFGKAPESRDHTGTLRALHLVEMHFDEYNRLGKYQKTDLAERIISIVHESGGRFLMQDENGAWIETELVESRKKIAHWFRHARSKRSKQDDNSGSLSSQKRTGASGPVKRGLPCVSPVDESLPKDDKARTELCHHTKEAAPSQTVESPPFEAT